jgi:hypothetical protein
MNEWEEEHLRRDVLFAPFRLLSGLVSGAVLAMLAFGIAWYPFWPSSFDAFFHAAFVLGSAIVVAGGLGAFMYAVRPIRHAWQLILSVAVGTLGAVVVGPAMRAAALTDCLHGTGPQERWCGADYSFVPFHLRTAIACAFVATAISVLGVRPRVDLPLPDGHQR